MKAARRNNVDFPAPEGAFSATSSPAGTRSDSPSEQCPGVRAGARAWPRRNGSSGSSCPPPPPSLMLGDRPVSCVEPGAGKAGEPNTLSAVPASRIWPASSTATCWARRWASARSWVTSTIGVPVAASARLLNTRSMTPAVQGSSAEVGSSISSRVGAPVADPRAAARVGPGRRRARGRDDGPARGAHADLRPAVFTPAGWGRRPRGHLQRFTHLGGHSSHWIQCGGPADPRD